MAVIVKMIAPIFLYTHITAGLIALVLFWVPIFTPKGSVNHRRFGRWYVNAMWCVVVTAILLSIKNVMIANYFAAAFLAFLALITLRPLWSGISILKCKHELDPKHQLIDRGLLCLIVVSGFVLIWLGSTMSGHGMQNVVFVFGVLGVSNVFELIRSFKNNVEVQWLNAHLSCLCITGIAAHTAFFVFGASSFIEKIFASYWLILPWCLPTVIGVIGIAFANRRFNASKKVI